MIYRPIDETGDVLPVLLPSDLLRGASAVAQHVEDRLYLLTGDWWENSTWGNEILEMLAESRMTEADQQVVSSYLSSYIRETPGVQEVKNVTCSVDGKQLKFSCDIDTDDGSARITYEMR